MKISDMKHEDLMRELDEVPGVKEFMESFPVLIAHQIIARRIDLGWTQEELAKQVKIATGVSMPQSTISRVEGASPGIKEETYEKILRTLGMKKLMIEFEDCPNATQNEIHIRSGSFA
jgi:transcriptional regulator with XRE-family HTH domain